MVDKHFFCQSENFSLTELTYEQIALEYLRSNKTVYIIDFDGNFLNSYKTLSTKFNCSFSKLSKDDILFLMNNDISHEKKEKSEIIYFSPNRQEIATLGYADAIIKHFYNILILVYGDLRTLQKFPLYAKILRREKRLKSTYRLVLIETKESIRSPLPNNQKFSHILGREYSKYL